MTTSKGQLGTISVILAARNVEEFLPQTLASLDAQTYPAFELIAVDDGSTDATSTILASYADQGGRERPVTVLRTAGVGLSAARNQAIRVAGGELILVLDGDDVLRPRLIEKAYERLMSDPRLDVVYPLFDHVDAHGTPLHFTSAAPAAPLTPAGLLVQNPIHSDSGVMVRKSTALAAGLFDETLTGYVGLDFWFRVLSQREANSACLDDALVLYRRRSGQITAKADRMQANFSLILAKIQGHPAVRPSLRRHALASQMLYWASICYSEHDYRMARHYTMKAWRLDPVRMLLDPNAHRRAAISAVSLLPRRVHAIAKDLAQIAAARTFSR